MNKTIRFAAIVFFLVLFFFSSYRMYELDKIQSLWGNLPLIFVGSLWALIVFVFNKKYNNPLYLGLASLSGLLLSFGFLNTPFTSLIFLGFVPLFIIEDKIAEFSLGKSGREVMKYAYHAFVVWNILATWWVENSSLVAGMVANFLNALLMATVFWLFHKLRWRFGRYAVFAVFWIGFEYLHLHWDISWPWLTLGNSFAEQHSWIQWYSWTGALGGSLWILAINILFFKAYQLQLLFKTKKYYLRPLGVLLIPLFLSLVMYYSYTEKKDGGVASVVAIQPNFEAHYEKFKIPEPLQLERFLRISASAIDSNTDYLVFPETSFESNIWLDRIEQNATVNELKSFVNRYPHLNLMTGLGAERRFSGQPLPMRHSVRVDKRSGSPIYWEAYNLAVQLSSHTDTMPIYLKSKFVPGAELIPYPAVFSFLEPVFKEFHASMEGYGDQDFRGVFRSGKKAIAPVICYESVYGDFCGGYVRNGAQALFIMTNDGWWDNSPGHVQHRNFARLRAIELRKDVVRSANMGNSCFINQRGDLQNSTSYGKEGFSKQDINLNNTLTFYARFGDYIGVLAAIFSCICLVGLPFFGNKQNLG
jgi:apolipoprotein N-acyltransferase